ncbi:acyloxyacyl hydrolase [Rhodomicrobium vannielii]|nr:acyloxyacyl hydrolase [Rhodomicrobium vannielii]
MATIDHMSNAGLCDTNRGLTNAGVRLGYKF